MSFIISGSNDFDEDPDLSVVKMTVTLNNGKTYSCFQRSRKPSKK